MGLFSTVTDLSSWEEKRWKERWWWEIFCFTLFISINVDGKFMIGICSPDGFKGNLKFKRE